MIEANTLRSLLDILNGIKNLSVLIKGKKISLSAKHLVFISESAVQEFLSGDMSRLRGPRTQGIYLFENGIFKFAKQIYRPRFMWGRNYSRWDDIPNFKRSGNRGGLVQRELDKRSFERELAKHDSLGFSCVKDIFGEIDKSFSFSEFLQISYYEGSCGGGGIAEHYEFKPIFIVALWIENLDEIPVLLRNYRGKYYYPHQGHEFRKASWGMGENYEDILPPIGLQKGESLLIPEMLLLGEISDSGTSEPFLLFHKEIGEILKFDVYNDPQKFFIFGPSLSIEEVSFKKEQMNIHAFDSSRVLRLSKDYMAGSCPFLFGVTEKGIRYIKEILVNSNTEEIELSNNKQLLIAELEDEVSYFTDVNLISDSKEPLVIYKDIKLNKGEYVYINCPDGYVYKKVQFKGSYKPLSDTTILTPLSIHSKIKLIKYFMLTPGLKQTEKGYDNLARLH
jgi:hypothetical protein